MDAKKTLFVNVDSVMDSVKGNILCMEATGMPLFLEYRQKVHHSFARFSLKELTSQFCKIFT
jgi:hypothetical protein